MESTPSGCIEDFQALSVKQGPFLGDEEDKVLVEATMIPVFEPSSARRGCGGRRRGAAGRDLRTFGDELPASSGSSPTLGCKHGVAVSSGTAACTSPSPPPARARR